MEPGPANLEVTLAVLCISAAAVDEEGVWRQLAAVCSICPCQRLTNSQVLLPLLLLLPLSPPVQPQPTHLPLQPLMHSFCPVSRF